MQHMHEYRLGLRLQLYEASWDQKLKPGSFHTYQPVPSLEFLQPSAADLCGQLQK